MAEKRQGDQVIGTGTAVVTQTKPKTQKPSMYRVLILNDDYTPMEFVVYVLERFFNKSPEAANSLSCCTFIRTASVLCRRFHRHEVAETKVSSGA